MTLYFDNLETLQQFTMQLDHHSDSLACKHCPKSNQFVSHGFVYKKQYNGDKTAVGKRLFCSNRHGKTGCGHTLRLTLAEQIPTLAYTTIHVTLFLCALITGASIQKAYHQATQTRDARNAYRWLHKLERKLIDYRQILKRPALSSADQFSSRTRRFQILLPTVAGLFKTMGTELCSQYQHHYQQAFI